MRYSQEQRDTAIAIAAPHDEISEAVMEEIRTALGVTRLSPKTVRRWINDRDVLSDQQQAFVYYYLQSWNATKAAQLAGYSERTAYSQGHALLKHPEIQARIQHHMSELAMDAQEVLTRLSAHARGDVAEFLGLSEEELNEHPQSFLVKKFKRKVRRFGKDQGEEETIELEIHDPQTALVHLGRHHKLFVERHEHTGADGGPIVHSARELTDDELAAIIRRNQ